ncbi:ABC-2 type transport system permease protein [Streptomyces zhaozhouensis]|uniref:Transport permease protein n=1 Tax=Streptomyces zhaozhouensis TaxID=1300267 RepID=A0A286DLC8_9ACTN|nr:ABC transporter permease [Streptomyces zhaozhouensis]SOD59403.1 ABC-2 type transport system permease protein [Streptomyces zhaozhouensis]
MPTVLADSLLVFERYARQTLRSRITLIFGLMQPMLFLGFFGPLLQDVPLGREGDSWQILVPGLLVQLALFSSSFAGFGILIEKQHGIVERMRVTPVSRTALLLGRTLRDVALLLVQSVILVLAGVAFGLRAPLLGVLIGFVLVAVLAASLASLSYAFAMRVNTPQEFAPVINSINLPAMLLSGILLPMALAPTWLDVISHLIPFRYLVDGVRAAFVGDYGDSALAVGALAALLLSAASLTLGTRLFRRAGA